MKIEQDDGFVNQTEKKPQNKLMMIIGILIAITAIIVVAIIVLISSMKGKKLSVVVNGQATAPSENTFLFTPENEVYVSISDIAPFVGYEAHNGEYKINSEDTTKMYVEDQEGKETTSFFLNSKTISKVPPDSNEDYVNIQLEAPVVETGGKLYVSAEGFMKGFNCSLQYNVADNRIIIQTLPYLVQYYETNIANYGYDSLSDDFNNQKALIYGMIVGSKQTTGKYGVREVGTNKEIIGPRYNQISFLEASQEFIITNASNKVGIAYSTGETKINVQYDEIKVLDSKLGYYLVKSNNKYGVVDSEEKLVIHIEYDNIGIDTTKFQNDKIANQYVLYDAVIPACVSNRWILFDINGKKITDTEFEKLGCADVQRTDRLMNSAVIIGKSGVIVVQKDGLYGGISTKGDMLIPLGCEDIYSMTTAGETTYYMKWKANEATYNAMDMIETMKKQIGGYEEEDSGSEAEPSTSPDASSDQDATSNPEENITSTPEGSVTPTPDETISDENVVTIPVPTATENA